MLCFEKACQFMNRLKTYEETIEVYSEFRYNRVSYAQKQIGG